MALGLDPDSGILESIGAYLGSGGFVMPVLVVCAVVLWYAIGARWALLQRGSRVGEEERGGKVGRSLHGLIVARAVPASPP